jgi:hypothetical protein
MEMAPPPWSKSSTKGHGSRSLSPYGPDPADSPMPTPKTRYVLYILRKKLIREVFCAKPMTRSESFGEKAEAEEAES